MNVPFQVLGQRVLVEVIEETESGIIMVNTPDVKKPNEFIKVVKVSSESRYADVLRPGDRVMIAGKFSGVVIDKKTYYLVDDHSIYGIYTTQSNPITVN